MSDAEDAIVWLFVVIGIYAAIQFLYDNLRSPISIIWGLLFCKNSSLSKRYGPWAVITGSSDGIGKEYAKNLAREGLNIMLISRTESKLVQIAQEIRSNYKVQVKWIAVDFSDGAKVYPKISSKLAPIEVGMLVNNVGMAHKHPSPFEDISEVELHQSLSVNILPTVMLTHMILPGMKRRRRGIIVNVTSSSGFISLPYVSMYAASKAFLNSLTQSLQDEVRGTGVQCQLVTPLLVDTNMSQQWQSYFLWRITSAGVVRYTKMATWMIGRAAHTSGHWKHAIQLTILRIFPRWTVGTCIGLGLNYLRNRGANPEKNLQPRNVLK
ncbi:very-long-chain 3-oxoacyl-CoA reductase-like [Toxorhynchites rutilus septentrionalis]|uniref:very-long-chain 3-oxoacyl-CoA reductase-like n=1 Tax=Toxorhynchites rutilus septentrionalis TaxID=329112 RepID=UPI00247A741E|nr:very-long-chain 3-oxoacyl-CoA reductase-like [Toxorhynchites rutilus septentrionalis]